MNVLVACEYSGTVRDAFSRKGHNAWSCDILPSETPGNHIQGDVLNFLDTWWGWDLIIAHPPCTYLCNSGVRWLHTQEGRWGMMVDGAEFFKAIYKSSCNRICVENPVMHRHASSIVGVKHTQIIHPWQFGHGETKATCLWLKNLPPLKATNIVSGREHRIHKMPPSKNRGLERSRTYTGIAEAMADQWG